VKRAFTYAISKHHNFELFASQSIERF